MDLIVTQENYQIGKVIKSRLGFSPEATFEVVELKGDYIQPTLTKEEKEARTSDTKTDSSKNKKDTSGTTVSSVRNTNAVNRTGSDVTIGQISAGG